MESTGARNIRIYDELKSYRIPLEQYWQDIIYYTLPRKAYITRVKNIGDRLPTDIYDSTAIMSNAYFAAGMQAYMSSPQLRWFSIGIKDRELMKQSDVLRYCRDTEDVLYSMINNSNFYQEDVESYLGLGSIGSDVMYAEEDLKEDVRFESLPIENIVLTTDPQGRANGAYLEYEFNAEQSINKFGKDKVSKKVTDCFGKGDYNTKFKYLFCVQPRDIFDPSKKDAKNMPYASLWIDKEEKTIVSEKGYREFPFFLTRFAKSKGDCYGYSPAMNVFSDIKMLNQMEKTNILGAQMAVRPPLEIPDEAFLRPFNFNPGGTNIKAAGYPNEHIVPIMTGANVPLGLDIVQYKQGIVRQAFYNDLFLSIEQAGKMTATEVSIRNNQRMQMLGSAVGNIMREKLSPVIDRVYAIAARLNKLPPLPPALQKAEYIINYISPLARAQKSLELSNLQQVMAIVGQFATANPATLDKVDFDKAIDYVAEITNVSPHIIRDDSEVEAIRQGRAEQQAMVQQLSAMQQGTDTIKSATEADKNIAEMNQPVGA